MALGLTDKKYIKVTKGGVTYNCIGVNVTKGGVTYNVWGSGSSVIYIVDNGVSYSEDVLNGDSVLSPTTFTPSKSGYTFVGWRTDKTASSDVLTSKTMDTEPITLYAVFKRTLTLTYYNNSSTASTTTGTQYYNNGTTNNPSVKLSQATASGWSARGWSTGTAADASIAHSNGASITLENNLTVYGCYSKTITVTYYDNSTTAKTTSGTRYYNSAGNYKNPSFTLTQAASTSGYTARGWSTTNAGNASITYNNGVAFTRDSDITLYGLYQKTITLTYYNNSTTAAKTTGTLYWAPAGLIKAKFTLSQAAKSGWTARGWATGTAGNASVAYSSISNTEFSDNATVYGLYSQSITCTFYSGLNKATSATAKGTRYYNSSGNTTNATITAPSGATASGWTWRGWSSANTTTADASASYANGATISNVSAAATYYGLYSQTITLSTVSNGSTAKTTGTRYHNSYGNTKNPTFTVTSPTRSGWSFLGWSTSASSTTVTNKSISSLELSADATRYAVWDCADVTGTASLNYENTKYYSGNETLATILSNVDTSKYSAVQFTFTSGNIQVTADYRGTQIDVYVSDGTNKTRIGYAYVDFTGDDGTQYTNQGIVLTPTLTFSSTSGTKNVILTSECHTYGTTTSNSSTGWVYVHGVSYKLIGRTVVY